MLDIPVIVTEQYPEKLGSTVEEIDISHVPKERVIAKQEFSMVTPQVKEQLAKMPERKSVVLFGIEVSFFFSQTICQVLLRCSHERVVISSFRHISVWTKRRAIFEFWDTPFTSLQMPLARGLLKTEILPSR